MKSKKRHHDSSEESEESDASIKSSSSSDSDSDDSSLSEHRHKKKRKRAESSDSDSNSDDQKRAKKRKHKKKKKKHNKKKRRSQSYDDVSDDAISISEGEISPKKKKKHKHKHSKRSQSSASGDEDYDNKSERRLHSVVKERRPSSEEGIQPSRTYYQKEYHRSASGEDYVREPQKYYQESSRPRHHEYQDSYSYDRDRNERFAPRDEKFERQRDKYRQNAPFVPNEEYSGRQRDYDEYKRNPRYEDQRRDEDHYRRERDVPYESREDMRGNNRYNRYERAPKRREFGEVRDYRERRGPAEPDRYRDKERLPEDRYSPERGRDGRRERAGRSDKPPAPTRGDHSTSKSPDDRYRETRRRERTAEREEKAERGRRAERSEGGERDERARDERPRERARERPRDRKTRFDNASDNKEYSWGKTEVKNENDKNPADKEKPNFGLSGKLTADANTVNGVVIKYTEPDDAKQPKRRWRFYPFKGDKALPILYIHRQSCFVIGRDKKVVDIALEHPSISKQHAALQYRATPFARADGSQARRVRPYLVDLDSANGTFVNNKKVEPRRYVELLERDVVKFGFSQREYVLLHENSKDDAQDDDQEPTLAVATTDQIKQEKRAKEVTAADGE
ncbi:smad nuclear-interacting protein 1 [Vanessa cardui]|uniref:smad nuclear-interacting protein 1 n=1 Tax=Vanessa cardui TaxID=171605 RepID=UPI001F12C81C|nr:smad nuclear-interacting protein 1 [Vanessa cardui]XP_046978196.1 smad nuclear-interacting protein 1 [Vanessa cardui]